jgi:cell division protein FtsQ
VTGPRRGDAPEAGRPEAGRPEAGVLEAGRPEAGVLEAGVPDGGMPGAWVGHSLVSEAGLPDGPVNDPPARRSLARTHSPWRTAFFGLAAVGIAAGVGWALLGSRLLVVRSVVVTGTHLVPVSEVRAAAAVPAGVPMVRVDTSGIASRVESITQVASAQVSKSWPDRIVIAVRERTPALAVRVPSSAPAGGGFDLIDSSGVIVRWARAWPRGMPLYAAPGAPAALRGDPAVAAAVTVLGEVPARISRSVAVVAAPSPQDVTLRLSDGVTIVWGGTGRPTAKAAVLAILMHTHARYYDVSAPGTAVTR